MGITLKEIAASIDAQLTGDPELEIEGVSSFEDATGNEITFACEPKYLKSIKETRAGAVLVPADFDLPDIGSFPGAILKTDNPKLHFFRLLSKFNPQKEHKNVIAPDACIGRRFACGQKVCIRPGVTIGDNVTIGERVLISPGVFIGDGVVLGDDVVIKPNVTLMEKTTIGSRVTIHSGTVIGSDGFGFTQNQGQHEKIPHAGFVQIDDDVEIGACNTIDRGTFGRTWIGRGVKTDNLIHIAHNVTVGENTLIVAQVGIAGSTRIGKNVILAGRAAVSGHLTIGDFSIVGPGGGVAENVTAGSIVSGFPSMPHKIWLKVGKILPRLPEFRKRLFSLEKKLTVLEQMFHDSSHSNH